MVRINCPKCGCILEHIRFFNEDLMGIEDNPYIGYVCRNKKCRGWYCEYCKEWHPYGTSCGVASVRNIRSGTDYLDKDPDWLHTENYVQNLIVVQKESGGHKE